MDSDGAAVLLHDPLADCESETRPLLVAAEARIEDLRQVLLRNAFSGVGKINDRKISMLTGRDGQRTARRRMPEGIDRQIENHLLQTVGIALDLHIVNFAVDRELDSGLLGERTDERRSRFAERP